MNTPTQNLTPELAANAGPDCAPATGYAPSPDERSLLEWAETLLCNAACPPHASEKEWSEIIHKWRDAKHTLPAGETTTARVRALLPYMREPESDMLRRALTSA
jgi:hypothetical protein